jgi:hypothetical protein
MNILVIPEDFRKDQYILKPIIAALFDYIGKPRAKVLVCKDPLLGGIDQATDKERITEIIERYKGMVQVFLLLVDRDAVESRRALLTDIEQMAANSLGHNRFYAENAWQELEVWTLAGLDLPADWQWRAVRAEPHPKERYFEPFAQRRGLSDAPGGGRKALSEEAARNIPRLRTLCPEDFANLAHRLAEKFAK